MNLLFGEDLNDTNFEEFQKKFGPKIKCLQINRKLIDWNLFQNIEKLKIDYIHIDSIIAQMNLAKLKDLEIVLHTGREVMLETVIDTFPTLTHLNVLLNSYLQNAIYNSLKNISNLKHLIHFTLQTFAINNNPICDLLKQMTNICKNLKSIGSRFNFDENSNIRQSLCQMKAFPALKRLNLWLHFFDNEVNEDSIDVNQLFSFELFERLLKYNSFETLFELETYSERIDSQRH